MPKPQISEANKDLRGDTETDKRSPESNKPSNPRQNADGKTIAEGNADNREVDGAAKAENG